MRVSAKGAALILPLFFVIGIGFTMATGYWQTESSKVPAKFTEGELAGEYNPADIRGSYSFEDIEKAFGISVETLAKAFGLSEAENPGAIQIKTFEELYVREDDLEIGTDSMRLFVALYLDRPYIPEEDTAIPQPAFNILKKEAGLTEEVLASLEAKAVALDSVHIPAEAASAEEEHEETILTEIKGKTTFAELLDSGLTREQIEKAIGMPMGQTSLSVRDYCMEQGVEFSAAKTALQELLDN